MIEKEHKYICLLCRKTFHSAIPPTKVKYMWQTLSRKPTNTGKRMLLCPYCGCMYNISYNTRDNEMYRETYRLYLYLKKHIIGEEPFDKVLFRQMTKWFKGRKRCTICNELKDKMTGYTYDKQRIGKLDNICKECRQSVNEERRRNAKWKCGNYNKGKDYRLI